jgi:hypothetical protein
MLKAIQLVLKFAGDQEIGLLDSERGCSVQTCRWNEVLTSLASWPCEGVLSGFGNAHPQFVQANASESVATAQTRVLLLMMAETNLTGNYGATALVHT